MIQNNRLWVLMSRLLSGEAAPAEAEELQQLLEESPQKQYLLDILHSYFTVLPANIAGPGLEDTDLEARFRKIVDLEKQEPSPIEEEPTPVIRRPFRKILGYAAAVAAAVLLGWGLYTIRPSTPGPLQQVRGGEVLSRAGARTKLVLPDGTQVWLNSSSRLKYTHNFDGPSREVELEGEAYFDVVKDMQRPFIVHTSALDVKVLGTAFTVKSYPQDATIEATLLKGAIEVSRQNNPDAPRVILKPNEKLVFNKQLAVTPLPALSPDVRSAAARTAPPDIAVNSLPRNIPDSNKEETAWLYNRLVFNGDSFEELAEKMERWYNVKIFFKDKALYNYHFGGAFANETVQDALNALQLTADFSYKINGNEIELYGK
ncbi:MAG TPA: FecR domain-containing protein [Puia sp.]|nr:FecR domain-containing protein [Puia sp.]